MKALKMSTIRELAKENFPDENSDLVESAMIIASSETVIINTK